MNDLIRVGSYVKSVDPGMYRRIKSIVGSGKRDAIGAYVETTDPEMFEQICDLLNVVENYKAVTA